MMRSSSFHVSLLVSVGISVLAIQPDSSKTHQLGVHHDINKPDSISKTLESRGSSHEPDLRDSSRQVTPPSGQVLVLASLFQPNHAIKVRIIACTVIIVLVLMGVILAPSKLWCSEHGEQQMTSEDDSHNISALAESSNGSWAQAYRVSNTEKQRAFCFLLQCKIISEREFAHSDVSQAHIEECVGIAAYLLTQRSLQEWVSMQQQALVSFEDNLLDAEREKVPTHIPQDEGPRFLDCADGTSGSRDYATLQESSPLHAALKDLLLLKDGCPSPLPKSNVSTAQTTPIPTVRDLSPIAPVEPESGKLDMNLVAELGLLDHTFDGELPQGCSLAHEGPIEEVSSASSSLQSSNASTITIHAASGPSSYTGVDPRRGSPRPQPRAPFRLLPHVKLEAPHAPSSV